MNDYRLFVSSLSLNKENRVFLNSDNEKMLSVFVEMFKNSETEFRIFAGNLCNDVTSNPEYIEAISSFIEKGGMLHILLNDFHPEQALISNLYKRLAYYQLIGSNIEIKTTTDNPILNEASVHLALGDRISYRIETDIEKRKAICNMYDASQTGKLVVFFDGLFARDYTKVVDLVSLFNMKG